MGSAGWPSRPFLVAGTRSHGTGTGSVRRTRDPAHRPVRIASSAARSAWSRPATAYPAARAACRGCCLPIGRRCGAWALHPLTGAGRTRPCRSSLQAGCAACPVQNRSSNTSFRLVVSPGPLTGQAAVSLMTSSSVVTPLRTLTSPSPRSVIIPCSIAVRFSSSVDSPWRIIRLRSGVIRITS